MRNDIRAMTTGAEAHGFTYHEVRETNRLQRACERWPLLFATHRALERITCRTVRLASPIPGEAAALWQE